MRPFDSATIPLSSIILFLYYNMLYDEVERKKKRWTDVVLRVDRLNAMVPARHVPDVPHEANHASIACRSMSTYPCSCISEHNILFMGKYRELELT